MLRRLQNRFPLLAGSEFPRWHYMRVSVRPVAAAVKADINVPAPDAAAVCLAGKRGARLTTSACRAENHVA